MSSSSTAMICSTVPRNVKFEQNDTDMTPEDFDKLTPLEQKMANKKKHQKKGNKPTNNEDIRFDRVIFLGTSSAIPVPGKRNMSSMMVAFSNSSSVMVDCGEGTQHQMRVCTRANVAKLDLVCITHLHGDHCYGLFGMLLSGGQDGRTSPMTIVGPKGIKDLVMHVYSFTGGWAGYYDLNFVEIPDNLHEDKLDVEITPYLPKEMHFLKLTATPLIHGMTCWGYVIEELERPGKLDVQKAKELGVPAGPLLGQLKKGNDVEVTTSDGSKKTVKAIDVVSDKIRGRKICVLQDSSDSSYAVRAACQDADLFIHEATLQSDMEQEAIEKGHSTPHMAARWANEANAKKLVLTHFSARYSNSVKDDLCCQSPTDDLGLAAGSDNEGSDVEMKRALTGTGDGSKKRKVLDLVPETSDSGVCEPILDLAEAVLGPEARAVFKGDQVIIAKDFLMLDGTHFNPCKELMVKRNPWARDQIQA